MEKPQEPEGWEEGKRHEGKGVSGIRGWFYASIAALGVSGIGCGSNESPTKKVEVSGPGGGPVPMRVHHVEKSEGGGKSGEGGKKEKEDLEKWKEVTLSIIGGHVHSDGRYYLKTAEVEGKKRVMVWELIEGDVPSSMKPPSRVTARVDEKDGRLDFDNHIYFVAKDSGAWERGMKAAKSPSPKKEVSPPAPSPKPIEEKLVPLSPTESFRVLQGTSLIQADGILVLHADGKEHRFSFLSGPLLPPSDDYRFRGQLRAGPGGTKGERRIIFDLPPVMIPGRRGPTLVGPTFWEWQETVSIKE